MLVFINESHFRSARQLDYALTLKEDALAGVAGTRHGSQS